MEHTVPVHEPAAGWGARAVVAAKGLEARVLADLPSATVGYVAECRYAGQGYELDVPVRAGAWSAVESDFHAVHQSVYGYRDAGSTVEVVALRAVGTVRTAAPALASPGHAAVGVTARLRIRLEGGPVDAAGYDWEALRTGQVLAGPAVVEGTSATALIAPGWTGAVDPVGAIVLERGDARTG